MKVFEDIIKYKFKNTGLLAQALTHSSYVNGKHDSNERLEFLGDSVLSVVVSKYLFEALDVPEGQLTRFRAKLVCEDTLFKFAQSIELGTYIRLGKGEDATGGRTRKSILADAFEALIAAIYLDGGIENARSFILSFMPPIDAIKSGKLVLSDYKTALQEVVQQNPEEQIEYVISGESGLAHQRLFTANVLLNRQIIGTGMGRSKKEAQQEAAKEALSLMGYDVSHF